MNNNQTLFLRYKQWSSERFPFVNIISGVLSFITMISIGRYIANRSLSLNYLDIIGALAFVSHLLLLRIFDEHKDYAIDKVNHPNRVLSKGIITLKDLKILAIPLPVLGVVWSYSLGDINYITLILWSIMFFYSILMTLEFFIGEWLSKKLFLYSLSHMIVSPLMILWVITGGTGSFTLSLLICLILAISLTTGLSYEFTRKTRGDEEDPNLDSYNKAFSTKGSVLLITALNLSSYLGAILILRTIGNTSSLDFWVLTLGYTCTFYPTANFLTSKTEKSRKMNEAGLGLFLLCIYFSILISLFIKF